MNILFVCLANLQRSPTAEDMVRDMASDEVEVKSAGVSPNAVNVVDQEILEWADRVYVMMEGIKNRIISEFSDLANEDDIKVLGIKDRYRRGEPRLKYRLLEEFSEDDFLSKFVEEKEIEDFSEESSGFF